ncbi:MAG: S-layer homology domain-containing protein [Clostridiales bacterium]|nr:S-layer homology domain-containing protein [Clostridiales bacterium]
MKKIVLIISGIIAGMGITGVYAEDYSISCDNQLRTVSFTVRNCDKNRLVVYVEDENKNIIAIGETEGENGIQTAVLPVPGNAAEGYYTAVAADCSEEIDVPSVPYADRSKKIYVSEAGGEADVIFAINTATENSIGAVFEQYEKELNLSLDSDYKPSCNTAFMNLKAKKTYTTFAEIMSDFNTAKAVGFYADAGEEELKAGAERYKRDAGIEFGEDYENYKSDIWRVFTYVRSKLTSSTDARSITAQWYSEAEAVAALNCADRTTAASVLEKYSLKLGIDYSKFTGLPSETKKMNVIKAVTGMNFNKASDVKQAYDNAVAQQSSSGSQSSTGGTGGTGGGSSVPSSPTLPYSSKPKETQEPTEPPKSNGFSDMPENHWAYKAVKQLNDEGVMTGYDDGSVKPDNSVTRAEFVKLLTAALGIYDFSAECEFDDVKKEDWYAGYIASAVNAGITQGYPDNTFKPNAPITREDAALMIYRAAGMKDESAQPEFTDNSSISDYAYNAVGALSARGILNGFDDGEFKPANAITRAQTAQIIYNVREEAKK